MSHQVISFLKSAVRMAGYMFILLDPLSAVVTLVVSEVIGVWEEVGH